MKISKSKCGNAFILSVEDKVASGHIYFTALEVSSTYRNSPSLKCGDEHKATLHLPAPDMFWQMVAELNVPVVTVSSSCAREGISIGAAA